MVCEDESIWLTYDLKGLRKSGPFYLFFLFFAKNKGIYPPEKNKSNDNDSLKITSTSL